MTTTQMELDSPLQALVDSRLDAIDRMLIDAGVTRTERAGIVAEVQAQVHELLARRTSGEPTRGDVLAVLASLDPPEAYAAEGTRQRIAVVTAAAPRPRVPQPCLFAVGGAVGAVLNLLAGVLLIQMVDAEGLLLVLGFGLYVLCPLAVTACGMVSIRQIRRSGGWLFGLPAAVFATILFPLLWLNGLLVTVVLYGEGIGIYLALGLALLAANGYLIYHIWRSVSTGYQRALPTLDPR